MIVYLIDIDGTIAIPRYFDDDLEQCIKLYLDAGIVKEEDVQGLQFHQQMFLMPHVLLTHVAVDGSVEALRLLAEKNPLQYFTVRQAFDPGVCAQVHQNTRLWLESCRFPSPNNVQFFWSAREKLTASLQGESDQVVLIDDRPAGLVKAYRDIEQNDVQVARQLRERLTLVAFGFSDLSDVLVPPGLRVFPLVDWSQFRSLEKELF